MISRHSTHRGFINTQLLAIFGLLVLVVALSGLSVWLYMQYDDQKTNVDSKISLAEAKARKEQAEKGEEDIKKANEEPNREFAGPEDYGSLSFKYPKDWSVYVASDSTVSGNKYTAYLHPIVVQPINSNSARFALKVNIDSTPYDKALDAYKSAISKGDLKSSPVSVNDHDGTRLDGQFTKDVRGSAVIFKVRDKTITISSEAEIFKDYFNTIVKTINFND